MHLAIHTSGHWHELKKSSMTLTDNATKHVRSNVRVSEIKCLQCHTKATAIRYNMHHGLFILEQENSTSSIFHVIGTVERH